MGYLANQPGSELTPEELIILSEVATLGDPFDVLRVNSTGDGVEYAPNASTDEKVKYDSSDPVAGYIVDKFVAGVGIQLSEGTGTDENKLKIENILPAGGVKSWFFTKDASDVAGMYNAETTLPIKAVQLITATANDGETTLAEFITPLTTPDYRVTDGMRFFYITAKVSNTSKKTQLRGEVWLTDLAGANQALLRTSTLTIPLTLVDAEYSMSSYGGSLFIDHTTTRVLFKIVSVKETGGTLPTVTLSVDDDTFSRLDVPSPVGVTDISGLLKIDQTTPQTTVGTFTFPKVVVGSSQNIIIGDSTSVPIAGDARMYLGNLVFEGFWPTLAFNGFYNSNTSQQEYISDNSAYKIYQDFGGAGTLNFIAAPVGTAGSLVSYTNALTITPDGRSLFYGATDDTVSSVQILGNLSQSISGIAVRSNHNVRQYSTSGLGAFWDTNLNSDDTLQNAALGAIRFYSVVDDTNEHFGVQMMKNGQGSWSGNPSIFDARIDASGNGILGVGYFLGDADDGSGLPLQVKGGLSSTITSGTSGTGSWNMQVRKTDNTFTDSGLIFSNNVNGIYSGLINETDGQVFSYGINVGQVDVAHLNTAVDGGIFRMDSRAGENLFSVIQYLGSEAHSTPHFRLAISPNGNTLINGATDNTTSALQVNGSSALGGSTHSFPT